MGSANKKFSQKSLADVALRKFWRRFRLRTTLVMTVVMLVVQLGLPFQLVSAQGGGEAENTPQNTDMLVFRTDLPGILELGDTVKLNLNLQNLGPSDWQGEDLVLKHVFVDSNGTPRSVEQNTPFPAGRVVPPSILSFDPILKTPSDYFSDCRIRFQMVKSGTILDTEYIKCKLKEPPPPPPPPVQIGGNVGGVSTEEGNIHEDEQTKQNYTIGYNGASPSNKFAGLNGSDFARPQLEVDRFINTWGSEKWNQLKLAHGMPRPIITYAETATNGKSVTVYGITLPKNHPIDTVVWNEYRWNYFSSDWEYKPLTTHAEHIKVALFKEGWHYVGEVWIEADNTTGRWKANIPLGSALKVGEKVYAEAQIQGDFAVDGLRWWHDTYEDNVNFDLPEIFQNATGYPYWSTGRGNQVKIPPRWLADPAKRAITKTADSLGNAVSDGGYIKWCGTTARKFSSVGPYGESLIVYNKSQNKAHLMSGGILWSYLQNGGCSAFGIPTISEAETGRIEGWYQNFEKGSIYWAKDDPKAQPGIVVGKIEDHYHELGGTWHDLGFPEGKEWSATSICGTTGTLQHFQGGRVFNSKYGQFEIPYNNGWFDFQEKYGIGGENGTGWPTDKPANIGGTLFFDQWSFERGYLNWENGNQWFDNLGCGKVENRPNDPDPDKNPAVAIIQAKEDGYLRDYQRTNNGEGNGAIHAWHCADQEVWLVDYDWVDLKNGQTLDRSVIMVNGSNAYLMTGDILEYYFENPVGKAAGLEPCQHFGLPKRDIGLNQVPKYFGGGGSVSAKANMLNSANVQDDLVPVAKLDVKDTEKTQKVEEKQLASADLATTQASTNNTGAYSRGNWQPFTKATLSQFTSVNAIAYHGQRPSLNKVYEVRAASNAVYSNTSTHLIDDGDKPYIDGYLGLPTTNWQHYPSIQLENQTLENVYAQEFQGGYIMRNAADPETRKVLVGSAYAGMLEEIGEYAKSFLEGVVEGAVSAIIISSWEDALDIVFEIGSALFGGPLSAAFKLAGLIIAVVTVIAAVIEVGPTIVNLFVDGNTQAIVKFAGLLFGGILTGLVIGGIEDATKEALNNIKRANKVAEVLAKLDAVKKLDNSIIRGINRLAGSSKTMKWAEKIAAKLDANPNAVVGDLSKLNDDELVKAAKMIDRGIEFDVEVHKSLVKHLPENIDKFDKLQIEGALVIANKTKRSISEKALSNLSNFSKIDEVSSTDMHKLLDLAERTAIDVNKVGPNLKYLSGRLDRLTDFEAKTFVENANQKILTDADKYFNEMGVLKNRGIDPRKADFKLKYRGENNWESPAGLKYYGTDGVDQPRVLHHLKHMEDSSKNGPHGVFTVTSQDTFKLADEAFKKVNEGGSGVSRISNTQPPNRDAFMVEMSNEIGYIGGQAGHQLGNPTTNYVRIVIERETNLISIFPDSPTITLTVPL